MGFILTRMSYTYMIHFNYSHLVTLASPPRLSLIAFLFPTIPPTVVVCVCMWGGGTQACLYHRGKKRAWHSWS